METKVSLGARHRADGAAGVGGIRALPFHVALQYYLSQRAASDCRDRRRSRGWASFDLGQNRAPDGRLRWTAPRLARLIAGRQPGAQDLRLPSLLSRAQ